MNQFDIKEVEKLLSAGKNEEATAYLQAYFTKPFTAEEKARNYIDRVLLYTKVMNAIDEEYKAQLQSILDGLKTIDAEEKSMLHGLEVAKVQADLNKV